MVEVTWIHGRATSFPAPWLRACTPLVARSHESTASALRSSPSLVGLKVPYQVVWLYYCSGGGNFGLLLLKESETLPGSSSCSCLSFISMTKDSIRLPAVNLGTIYCHEVVAELRNWKFRYGTVDGGKVFTQPSRPEGTTSLHCQNNTISLNF